MCCNCCGRNSDQNAKCHSAGSWGQRCALGLKTQRQLQSVALRRLALGLVLSSGSSKTPVSFSKPAFCFRNRRFVFETGVLLVAGWPNRRFAGCWLAKPAFCWLLVGQTGVVAGCWLLVAGCWLLVAGCVWLVRAPVSACLELDILVAIPAGADATHFNFHCQIHYLLYFVELQNISI